MRFRDGTAFVGCWSGDKCIATGHGSLVEYSRKVSSTHHVTEHQYCPFNVTVIRNKYTRLLFRSPGSVRSRSPIGLLGAFENVCLDVDDQPNHRYQGTVLFQVTFEDKDVNASEWKLR